MTPATPAPGSPEAVSAGCTCPVLDNSFGKGVEFDMCLWTDIDQGELKHHVHKAARYFWVSADCPLHGHPAPDDIDAQFCACGHRWFDHDGPLGCSTCDCMRRAPAGKDGGDAS